MTALPVAVRFLLLFLAATVAIALFLFVPAGTLDYWQAWLYMAVVLLPAAIVITYFMINDPAFLERRLRTREKETKQQLIIKFGTLIFIAGFLIPGLDHLFGWSDVPFELVVAADALVFLSYMFIFLVFKENSWAGRTVQVEKGQKVVTTGPYAIMRHPMYFGAIIMYVATPIALGSYWALPPFLFIIPIFIYRILNEEEVLRRELPGYIEYCKKTRYRLLPYVW